MENGETFSLHDGHPKLIVDLTEHNSIIESNQENGEIPAAGNTRVEQTVDIVDLVDSPDSDNESDDVLCVWDSHSKEGSRKRRNRSPSSSCQNESFNRDLVRKRNRPTTSRSEIHLSPTDDQKPSHETDQKHRSLPQIETQEHPLSKHIHSPTNASRIFLTPGDTAVLTPWIVEEIHKNSLTKTSSTNARKQQWNCLSFLRPLPSNDHRGFASNCCAPQHIRQPDSWSCGYRNYQMMLSALLPRLPQHHSIFSKFPFRMFPNRIELCTIAQLQGDLETIWQVEGKDPQGAQHYNYRLLGKSGNAGKIGALEVAHLSWHHGIDSVVVQFVKCFPSRSILPWFAWVYFSSAPSLLSDRSSKCLAPILLSKSTSLAVASQHQQLQALHSSSHDNVRSLMHAQGVSRLPLYLQWEGHSVTIVGVEMDGNCTESTSISFLVLDPMKKCQTTKAGRSKGSSILPDSVRLPWSKLKEKDLQIVLCTEVSITYTERQEVPKGRIFTAAPEAVLRGR